MKLDGKSIQTAIHQIIGEYKFDPQQILEIVKLGIKSAFRKDYLSSDKKISFQVAINKDGDIKAFREYEVVKEVEDPDRQMEIKQAKKHRSDIKEWETLYIDITPTNLEFSRIAVQAAAQTIKQSLKKIERERFFEKFQDKQWELLRAKVLKVNWDSVVLDIDGTTVILPPEWQIPNRLYNPWEEILVLLRQISKWTWWIVLDITQWSTDFIQAILIKLVPELEEGKVKIEKMVRMPWKRTKVLVSSEDERIDPVGVFIGSHWNRITTILSVLDWEKIDFIENHEDAKFLISESLKPARIDNVQIQDNKATVKVAEDQKALAIWKAAINIKLASQLTWYKIDLVD